MNPAGANGLLSFASPKVGTAGLAAQICPTNPPTAPAAPSGAQPTDDAEAAILVSALTCFDRSAEASPRDPGLLTRRNSVQDYLIMWSNQNCALWFTYLERADALNRGTFNVLSVVTGGAGAMVSGPASRVLSGVSGISSGTGAAIDAAMLHGLTEGLIMPRIVSARQAKLTAIYAHRADDLTTYPMARALGDGLDYHGACNLSAALQQDTPAPHFGPAGASATTASIPGSHSPTAADVKVNAVFLTSAGKVLRIDSAPASAAGSQTVGYTTIGPNAVSTSSTPADFLALVAGGLVIPTS